MLGVLITILGFNSWVSERCEFILRVFSIVMGIVRCKQTIHLDVALQLIYLFDIIWF